VTGGLPYFGGPGNNYSMHALAEVATRLRGSQARALVTANGGMLSKHAAAVLRAAGASESAVQWRDADVLAIQVEDIPTVDYAQSPDAGRVISYTVIARRGKPDIGIVLAETGNGERFLASNVDTAITDAMKAASPVGRPVKVIAGGERRLFEFATQ
jgi:acetyl-CoA C-acetyltransferase